MVHWPLLHWSPPLTFILASVVLMLIPGPNVALIVATSVGRGTRSGLLTVAGTASAMALQLVMVGFGLAGLLGTLGHAFGWVRWLGAGYLLALGVRQWRAPPGSEPGKVPPPRSKGRTWKHAFIVSLCNPKTMLFYGAFFPQFMSSEGAAGPQATMLCIVFLTVVLAIDSGWALAAGRVGPLIARRAQLGNRIAGSVLIAGGVGLMAERVR